MTMEWSPNLYRLKVVLRTVGESTAEDRYGNPVPGPNKDAEAPAWYEPVQSGENVSAAEQQIHGYWVFMPTPWKGQLKASDFVVIDGVEHHVIGEVGHQPPGLVIDGYLKFKAEVVDG